MKQLKLPNDTSQCVPIRVTEMTLFEAYGTTYSRMDQEKFVEDSLEDCSAQNHTPKVSLSERAENLHKGKTKKNLRLVEKVFTLAKLADLFKTTLIGFLCHQFNVNQASKIHDQTRAGMGNSIIVKNHDFSENYTSFA